MKTPLCHARLAGALPLAGRLITGLLITSLLSACATNPEATKATGVGGQLVEATAKAATSIIGAPLIPEATVQLGPSVAYPLEKLVYLGHLGRGRLPDSRPLLAQLAHRGSAPAG